MKKGLIIFMLALFTLIGCNGAETPPADDPAEDPLDLSKITDRTSTFEHFSELEIASAAYQIVNGDFETGNLDGWYSNEADVFEVTDSDVDIWSNPVRKVGNYYLGYGKENYVGTKEALKGSLRSSLFKVGGMGKITFRMGGSNSADLRLKIMSYDPVNGDETIGTFNNVRFSMGNLSGFIMVTYAYVIPSEYLNKLCYLLVEDQSTSSFGFINLDNINTYYNEVEPVFVSSVAGYQEVNDRDSVLATAGNIVSIDTGSTGKRTFNLNENFSSSSLKIYATYENGIFSLLPTSSYAINWSAYDKTKVGEYEISIALMNSTLQTKYTVKVVDEATTLANQFVVDSSSTCLMIGDSLTDFWQSFKTDFPEFASIENLGVGGTQFPYWYDKIDTIATKDFSYIFMTLGANDSKTGGASAEEIKERLTHLLDLIHEKMPNTKVCLFTITESPGGYYGYYEVIHQSNIYYKQLAEERSYFKVIDCEHLFYDENSLPIASYFTDGAHYQQSAYTMLTNLLKKELTFK